MANHLSNTTVSLKTQHHVLHLCFSIVCLLCAVTVHLVFRRLHPWEVCGWQASQRAARFPGWSEERTRTSPWVTDENMLTVYEHSCSSLMKGWLIFGEFVCIPGTCPWSCVTHLLVTPWSWVSWGTCKSCWVRILYPGWAYCAGRHRKHPDGIVHMVSWCSPHLQQVVLMSRETYKAVKPAKKGKRPLLRKLESKQCSFERSSV